MDGFVVDNIDTSDVDFDNVFMGHVEWFG